MEYFKKIAEKRKADFMANVGQDIEDRIASGEPISMQEWESLRANSYERKQLFGLLDDKTLLHEIKFYLDQAGMEEIGKYELPKHYNDAIERQHIHELIRRFEAKIQNTVNEEE